MKKTAYILTLGLLTAGTLITSAKSPNVNDIKHTITDNNIIYPESYELDTQRMMEGWYLRNYTATDDRYKRQGDVKVDDATMRDRLAKLPTVIEMPYNSIVRNYIERYTSRGRDQVAALLGLSLYYMPIFEQALEENGLPLELKYLPVIESGLDPNAVSKHGAAGLWQFMIGTGKGLGMEVSSLVDERRDPYISSQKAARYLKDLYSTYNDWSLAIAAYNCGPGAVNKAIRRAGGNPSDHDFWSIYYYLSPETRGYVPQFIAANYVMNYYPEHNISPVLPTKPLITDTIMVSNRVHLQQISHVLNIPIEELRVLNPQFRADIVPGSKDHAYTLVLPSQQCHAYLMSEADILNYEPERYTRRVNAEPGKEPNAALTAKIESEADNIPAEEVLEQEVTETSRQARQHNQEQSQQQYAQNTPSSQSYAVARGRRARNSQSATQQTVTEQPADLQTHQTRKKNNSESQVSTTSGKKKSKSNSTAYSSKKKKSKAAAKPNVHNVKSGDNLYTIAKRYGTTVDAIKRANNIKGSGDDIHPGDKIKIPSSGKKSKAKSGKSKSKSKKKRKR